MGSTIQRDETRRTRRSAFDPGEGVTRSRCRSFLFLERAGVRWTAFIVTYQRPDDGHWRGYFAFRCAPDAEADLVEVRTADLFVEATEQEVDERARGLGRPLVAGLLDSAVDTAERRRGPTPDVQRWFREMLARHASERAIAPSGELQAVPETPSLSELRQLYESYCLDQVSHWIALLEADDFREFVEVRLEGRRIDFHSRDRLQLAMSVVQEIERRLPLPPFEIWVEDYLAHTDEYQRYTWALHQGGELP
ncbi:MAG: hypothetical protein L0271_11005 [Gemmatimonadetes bacterium]|nr:hypothetical protein [Gemmatimonadota bacterium]